jgi:hypothetical protein
MKVVINKCYGGFGISEMGQDLYKERKGITDPDWYYRDVERNDPVLIELIEQYGDAINGRYADLRIVEIPDGVEWQIEEYDGNEWIAEKHRTWT